MIIMLVRAGSLHPGQAILDVVRMIPTLDVEGIERVLVVQTIDGAVKGVLSCGKKRLAHV
ncbi:MAG TPA: hypothetical protein VJK09_01735 [Candidatus Paceibacterota bacterium]